MDQPLRALRAARRAVSVPSVYSGSVNFPVSVLCTAFLAVKAVCFFFPGNPGGRGVTAWSFTVG